MSAKYARRVLPNFRGVLFAEVGEALQPCIELMNTSTMHKNIRQCIETHMAHIRSEMQGTRQVFWERVTQKTKFCGPDDRPVTKISILKPGPDMGVILTVEFHHHGTNIKIMRESKIKVFSHLFHCACIHFLGWWFWDTASGPKASARAGPRPGPLPNAGRALRQ
jgi:hypothetical protein